MSFDDRLREFRRTRVETVAREMTQRVEGSKAFGRGYKAFKAGRAIWANPFDSHTSHDAQEWWKGWRAGKREADEPPPVSVEPATVDAVEPEATFTITTPRGAGRISAADSTFNPAINLDSPKTEPKPRLVRRAAPPNYERMRERLRERFAPELDEAGV